MSDCNHPHLTATAQVYQLTEGEAPFETTRARSVHMSVRCAQCGVPFRCIGTFRQPPTDLTHAGEGEPWSNWNGSEVAMWIEPLAAGQDFAAMPVAGSA